MTNQEPIKLVLKALEVQKHDQQEKEQTNDKNDLKKAKEEAETILKKAYEERASCLAEIDELRNNWQKEREAFIQEAQKIGYDEGFHAGEKAGFQAYEAAIKKVEHIMEVAKTDYVKKIESAEEQIVLLAMKAAEKIVKTTLAEEPKKFQSIVKAVIEEVKDYPEVKIFVHPEQYEFILFHKEEFEQLFTKVVDLFIIPDAKLKPFSVHVESTSGKIDASIETQIEQLKNKLLDFMKEG